MSRHHDEPAQRERVRERIEDVVLDFVREHASWYESELADYVRARCGGSSSSASRILRLLADPERPAGSWLIEYEVKRSASHYTRVGMPRRIVAYREPVQESLFGEVRA